MSNLLSLHFWFNLRPGAFLPATQNFFTTAVAVLFFLAIASSYLKKKDKKGIYRKVWHGLYYFSITNVFIGLVLLFFTYEMVPMLSARFWFLFWAVGMIIWLYFILRNLRTIPKRRAELELEKEYKKYIP